MLGSEYNWLVSLTSTAGRAPKVRLAKSGLFTLAVAVFCFFCIALHAEPEQLKSPDEIGLATNPGDGREFISKIPALEINVRDCGAIGDGKIHLVHEWIEAGRYHNMRELRRACPSVQSADWTVDEAAFDYAKTKLLATGGTIYFPEGRYLAAHGSWTVVHDHVRLLGDGADRSILDTAPGVSDGLVLSPYRHIGWLEHASEQFPFASDSGQMGATGVTLGDSSWTGEFHFGDLVFIRNGACRFDQDYGEFNEVASVGAKGELNFRHPLSRDYTLDRINWAGTVAADFTVPKPQRAITVSVSAESGNFQPSPGEAITIGDQLFEVVGLSGRSLRVRNPGRAGAAPGTKLPAGSRISKSRAIIKVTQSTRDFKAEKLQIIGHRKVLNLSNSYGMEFSDCLFVRDAVSPADHQGGLTIDGDGGRWARFSRCTLRAAPPWGMQFARSFGGVTFDSCTFENTNVAFTEFSFDCEVTNCDFDFHGPKPEAVIIVGKSGGNFRITANRIHAENAPAIFDARLDIQSQKHSGEGRLVIRNNTVETTAKTEVFRLHPNQSAEIEGNKIVTR